MNAYGDPSLSFLTRRAGRGHARRENERAANDGFMEACEERYAGTPDPNGRPCSLCGAWCFIGANCPGCIAETCSDPSCPECGGVRAEHIELAGPLTAPLALLARVA